MKWGLYLKWLLCFALLGIRLFDAEPRQLSLELRHAQEKIALLPSSVRCSTKALDDDF